MALILRSSGSPLTNDQIDGNFTYLRDNAGLTGDVVSTGNATTVNKINGVTLSGLSTGILRNTTGTGAPVIAVAADFPTLNQNTTGSAATLTTSRNINGVAFNGSADITIKATATNILTFGTNLTGTSYDGSSAVTIGIGTAVALRADTTFIGTTSVALNRTSANLALAGILSVTMQGSTSGSVQLIPTAAVGTGTILTIPATTGTIVTTGDSATVTNTMLSGSIANSKLTNSSLTVGTTAISLGGSSTTLAGLTSVTLSGSVSGTVQLIPVAAVGTGTVLTIPAVTGTIVTTGDTATVTNTMLAGSIANAKLVNSSLTVGTTAISLGSSSTTLAGLTSVTSTGFTGALTGNASTATTLATARNINGVSFNGSADITIKATATNILTIGSGLTGTSYDGSSAVTVAIGSTVALRADTTYIGTTAVTLNRTSANLALAGILSVTMQGSTSGSVQLIPSAIAGTSTILTMPATSGTIVTTGDTGTVTNTMLAGSIANVKLTNSSLTVGTTSISLGGSATTLAGLTSVTSTGFTGALTGNASTATKLATARNINGVAFDGTSDITIGIPLSSGITGLATGIATFLATPTSANLATAVTNETGTGLLVFNTSPVISTSITTASTSFALLNTNATTVNFAGAATTLNMGASTGTSTVNNDLVVSGNLTVNGTTTTINTSTLVVDDKNIELGAVPSATISTTGTVGTITGTGPWSAVITGMTSTTGLIVGSSLSATNGTGSLGGSGSYIVTSIDSKTQITYSATGGTTPTAGTITTITTTGYNNTTANGAGITIKGATDKTLNWVGTTTAWTSSENLDIASGKSYLINGTSILSSSTLGSSVTASSLTSVGTLTSVSTSGQFISTAANNIANGGGQIYLNGATGNRIDFNNNGVGAPTYTTRSAGTKIVLFTGIGASAVDYALGIEGSTLWSSVPVIGSFFKWYAGTANVATLSGTGTFSTTNLDYTGTLTGGTGILNIGSGQIYKDASGNVGIGTSSPAQKLEVYGVSAGVSSTWQGGTDFIKLQAGGVGNGYSEQCIAFQEAGTNIGAKIGVKNRQNGAYDIIFANRDNSSPTSTLTEKMRIDSSGNVGIGTSTIASRLSIKGTTATDAPTLGAELLTGGTWTSTGWTGNNTTGWINGASNATALSYSVAATVSTRYQIAYTVTGYSAGSFTVAFGGQSLAGITATGTFGPTATTTGNLVITPTATFVGTIVVSIKAITAASTALITALDSTGASRFEIRAAATSLNTYIGTNSGRYNTTGVNNTGIGFNTLISNTTGYNNLAVGANVLFNNTTGISNCAFGVNSMVANTTGSNNLAIGVSTLGSNTTGNSNTASGLNALFSNTTGNSNTASGNGALLANTTGIQNTASGANALALNTTGNNNSAVGTSAGRIIADGVTALTVVNNSTYLGTATKASADNVTNETVIGYNATGAGSNTTVIGTSSTVSTTLFGNIIINNGAIGSATLTTSATTANQVIDSNSSTVYRSVKYEIQMTATISSVVSYHSCTVKIIHDGTTAHITQYGDLYTNASVSLATFDADISGGNLRLLTTPTTAVTVYKVIKTLINI